MLDKETSIWKRLEKIIFRGDSILLLSILLLMFVSIPIIYSSIGRLAYVSHSQSVFGYLFQRVVYLFLGWGSIIFFQQLNYKKLLNLNLAYGVIIGAIALLLITHFFGINKNDSVRSLSIPYLGITFQPSDFARIAAVFFLATILNKQDRTNPYKILKQIVVPFVLLFALVFFHNLSTALILGALLVVLLFVSGFPTKILLKFLSLSAIILVVAISVMYAFDIGRSATWVNRVTSVFEENKEAAVTSSMSSYKPEQEEYARGAIVGGGFFGLGPGNSLQKNSLAQAYSDFVYAIIIEEYGLIGGLIVMLLYMIFFHRCITIVRKIDSPFGQLLVTGLCINIMLQVGVNMMVSVDFGPVTGQALPFVSVGGSSLLFFCSSVGVILGVSKDIPPPNAPKVYS